MTFMFRKMMRAGLRSCVVLSVLMPFAHATTILTLNPANGLVSGGPGQVVGWGFSIVDDTNWVLVVATDFCSSFDGKVFQCSAANPVPHGTYTDFSGFNFDVSSPTSADTSQQNFNAGSHSGTGSFQNRATAHLSSLST